MEWIDWVILLPPGTVLLLLSMHFLIKSIETSRTDPVDSRNAALMTIYYLILSTIWWVGGIIFLTRPD